MSGAEGVVDVIVLPGHQAVYEVRVVGLFARIEAKVVERVDSWDELGQPGS